MPLEPPVTSTTRSLTLKSASISMVLEKEKGNKVWGSLPLRPKSQAINAFPLTKYNLHPALMTKCEVGGKTTANQASLAATYPRPHDPRRTVYITDQALIDAPADLVLLSDAMMCRKSCPL